MSSTAHLLSVEEFLRLPEQPGLKRELVEGVVVEMGTAALRHEIVKSNFIEALTLYTARHRVGKVFSETTFVLSEGTIQIPDVALVFSSSLARQDPASHFHGAPDLAVEVVSSESAAQLESKIRAYLRAGSRAVWAAFPEQRIVRVCRPEGASRWLEHDQILESPDLLPGFAAKVAEIFEGA